MTVPSLISLVGAASVAGIAGVAGWRGVRGWRQPGALPVLGVALILVGALVGQIVSHRFGAEIPWADFGTGSRVTGPFPELLRRLELYRKISAGVYLVSLLLVPLAMLRAILRERAHVAGCARTREDYVLAGVIFIGAAGAGWRWLVAAWVLRFV